MCGAGVFSRLTFPGTADTIAGRQLFPSVDKLTKNNGIKEVPPMKEILSTQAAPAAIGPYSQGVSAGGIVITSGQLPVDPATGAFAEGGVAGQTRQSL